MNADDLLGSLELESLSDGRVPGPLRTCSSTLQAKAQTGKARVWASLMLSEPATPVCICGLVSNATLRTFKFPFGFRPACKVRVYLTRSTLKSHIREGALSPASLGSQELRSLRCHLCHGTLRFPGFPRSSTGRLVCTFHLALGLRGNAWWEWVSAQCKGRFSELKKPSGKNPDCCAFM